MKLTVSLTDDAAIYLRSKLHGKRNGAGALISSLLLAQEAREESRRTTQEPPRIRAPWEGVPLGKVRQHHER